MHTLISDILLILPKSFPKLRVTISEFSIDYFFAILSKNTTQDLVWAAQMKTPVLFLCICAYTYVVYVHVGMYVHVFRSEVKVSSLTAHYCIFETTVSH